MSEQSMIQGGDGSEFEALVNAQLTDVESQGNMIVDLHEVDTLGDMITATSDRPVGAEFFFRLHTATVDQVGGLACAKALGTPLDDDYDTRVHD